MEIIMSKVSLFANIAILIPVCAGLITNARWVHVAYGDRSPARDILLSIYFSIAAVSAFLLLIGNIGMIAALLLVQVVYKILSALTVGTLRNPVVVSNLLIAILHMFTVATIFSFGSGLSV